MSQPQSSLVDPSPGDPSPDLQPDLQVVAGPLAPGSVQDLRGYERPAGKRRARLAWWLLWWPIETVMLASGLMPSFRIKRRTLRWCGAKVGMGLVMKPYVRVKDPRNLTIGDYCWIGEDVWIDNLAHVTLGDDVCLSQGVYLCTGSHDHTRPTFDLITAPITIEDQAWVGAKSVLMPGVTVGAGAVVAAGSIVTKDVPAGMIVGGNPAKVLKPRTVSPAINQPPAVA
ncbi:WcaF family extracellular polysaccharide biosynthesis acetyltransferase [Alienimonas chondri]|uniref:2,3,4,5-tetrahydropyridine-2,6-dicarboxylate N-acetyltransferase n=1 Tax=Alienimonas chondri TaxID=2681879 RepID=A0ABX1VK77_9PLAN|nr:WcaF family extracellular polysaccharide biosynthesis acetyltransferase [Alienimonas chondri]NNJ27572.1 2,3,4,5-tetrahydropyridine-2,6-dicarboxylate N-acetyltransferase [Alienimonas chondri]